mgnify:FL=1
MKRNDIDDLTPYQKRKKNSTLKNTNKRAPKTKDEDANLVDEPIGHESEVAPKKKKTSSTKKTSKPKKTEEPKAESKDGDPVIEGVTGHESGHESSGHESGHDSESKVEPVVAKESNTNDKEETKPEPTVEDVEPIVESGHESESKKPSIFKEEEKKVEEPKVENTSKRPKAKTVTKVFATITCIIAIIGIIGGIGAIIFANKLLEGKPEFDRTKLESQESSVIYDMNGNEIVELGLYLRENIEYDDMPNSLVDAFLSIEDSRYFEHFGFDIPRFTKAILENIKSGGFGQGGSTMTMQLVKNSYFQVDADGESTMAAHKGMSGVQRKMQEIVLAIEANKEVSKKDILALYINKINYGNNIRGVQKAAQYYFGKDASELGLVESAFLAGIINAPNNYNPYNELYKHDESYIYLNSNITYLENAQKRTAEVLDLMAYHGYITKEESALAKTVKIENLLTGVAKKFNSYSQYYQDYIDAVIEEATEVTGKNPYTTSMHIYTAMNPYMQEVLYNIENEKTDLKYSNDLEQSALTVLNNQTGELIALGGGRNQAQSARQFNRATSSYLQPGSSIKPVIEYALAFDRLGWSTAHTITDMPYYLYGGNVLIANAGGQGYTGDMLITEAIARSLNTPAVQTLQAVIKEIGEDGVKEYLREIGITRNLDTFDLQWAIGGNTCLVTPVQLAAAHAIFMNDGYYVKPHTIKKIVFQDDSEYVSDTKGTQVISSAAAYMTATCLEYNVSGPYYNNMQILKRKYPVYAKTGTTDWSTSGRAYGIPTGAPKDMWLVCQNSNFTISIWLGFDRAEVGSYFTTSEDMANLKGRIGRYILNELDENVEGNTEGVQRPDDVSDVTIVKGAYPYCAPDGGYETVKGLIKTSALKENPLTSVSSVLSNLPVKENANGGLNATGSKTDDGRIVVNFYSGGYFCSNGQQDLTATNVFGKTTNATGRCYFPHYQQSGSSSVYGEVTLYKDGEYFSSQSGEGAVEFSDVGDGSFRACVYANDQESCTDIN